MVQINSETAKAVGQMLSSMNGGTNTVSGVYNLSTGDAFTAGINSAEVLYNLATLFGKGRNGVDVLLSTGALLNDLQSMSRDYNGENGAINKKDLYSAASNLASILTRHETTRPFIMPHNESSHG
jgi:hypothetical protein